MMWSAATLTCCLFAVAVASLQSTASAVRFAIRLCDTERAWHRSIPLTLPSNASVPAQLIVIETLFLAASTLRVAMVLDHRSEHIFFEDKKHVNLTLRDKVVAQPRCISSEMNANDI